MIQLFVKRWLNIYLMKTINFALLVHENVSYPVTYTIKQNGEKVKQNAFLKGGDLTENQIKELYYKGHFEEKPTQEEIDSYLDSLNKKRQIHLQIGMRVKVNSDTKKHFFNAGKVKTITSELPNFGSLRAFGLDGDTGIWCIEDFEYCVDYPNHKMK